MLRRGKKLHKGLVDTYGGFIKEAERKMLRGEKVTDCLAKTMIELRHKEDLDDLDMAILASAFMIGGVETVSCSVFDVDISVQIVDLDTDCRYHAMVLCSYSSLP